MVHLYVILCVSFLITFEMAMWTFNATTLMYRSNVPPQNPLETCPIITMSALKVFYHRLVLSGLVKVQGWLVWKAQITNIAHLLDFLVNYHVVTFYWSFPISWFVIGLEIAQQTSNTAIFFNFVHCVNIFFVVLYFKFAFPNKNAVITEKLCWVVSFSGMFH